MRISAEHLLALSPLLDEAMDLPEDAREQWLGNLSEPFPGAKEVLCKMLKGDASGEGVLDTLLKVPLANNETASGDTGPFKPNAQIGNYRLERVLGTGGMGAVWLARRTDELINRAVALKLPHLHLQSAVFAERFARERDILANLTHPNIAHLYDAGITPEGQPYLAMEYVSSESLTQYCASHGLNIEQRLDLFLQVLSAVHYAHTQNVIHRDLKPSNILVREGGQVVLLDFGIAKLLVEGETSESALTRHGGAALTPDYASPEQISGEPLGPVSDIYTLGVVLYELLAGQRPYQLKQTTRRALEQAILSSEPRPPSEMVTGETATKEATTASHRARRTLQGDLDTIVLKALKKSPDERYATASDFADDLRRYLRGEAVRARPDSLGYRLRKLAHRHRSALQVAALAGLAGAAITIIVDFKGGWVSDRNAPAPLPKADSTTPTNQVNPKSVAVLPFIDMSEKKDQEYFSDGLTEELIDHLAHSKELKVIARTSSFQFKGKNDDVRSIAAKLGVANLLEGSVRKSGDSLRITAQLIKAADGVHLWSQTYDRNLKDVFKIQDEIAATVARSLSVALSAGDSSARSTAASSEAYNLVLEANFRLHRHDAEGLEKAVDLYKEAIKIDPSYTLAWAGLGGAYFYQAFSLKPSSADRITRVEQAKQAEERALSIDPDLFEAHEYFAFIYMFMDWDWSAAGAEIERCREIDSDGPGLRNAVAVYSALFGRLDEAIRLHRQVLDRDPLSFGTLNNLAGNLFAAGQFNDSVSTYRKLLDLNPKHPGAHSGLAISLLYLGKMDEALAAAENDSDEDARLKALSLIYWAMGRRTDSDAALSTLEGKFADDDPFNIASVHAYRGEADATFRWLDRAYKLHTGDMTFLKIRRQLLSLHDDPRYTKLLKKMKLDGDRRVFDL